MLIGIFIIICFISWEIYYISWKRVKYLSEEIDKREDMIKELQLKLWDQKEYIIVLERAINERE